jgi:FkbM family methyltransferase
VRNRWLLLLSAGALIWGVALLLTGGFVFELAGWRFSSTHAGTAFWIAAASFAAHYLLAGVTRLPADLASTGRLLVRRSRSLASVTALFLLAGIVSAAVAARACAAPPSDYRPLPIVSVSPVVLDDGAEIRDYINAFPIDEYLQYRVRGVGRFFIDNAGDEIKRVIVAGDVWERHIVALLEEHIQPGTVVVEVGAHIGTHTVTIARVLGPWGRVYAFEPQRKMFRELHHNLALNGLTNAVILRYAVGSEDGRIVEMNPASPGNEGGTGIGSGGDRVELRTLDGFKFERVSLIKIDAEHYENEILDGAVDTIRRNRPVILIEIMGGQNYQTASPDVRERIHATWKKLERLGYTVTPVFNHDYIALPTD